MEDARLIPDMIFESSWEVCNKVGGIYTVLSTRARSLQEAHKDRVFFLGPDLGGGSTGFTESPKLLSGWTQQAKIEGLHIRVGRWDVPGKPITILFRFDHNYPEKDRIYGNVWKWFGVDSLAGYGDYDESCMFAWACGQVIESYLRFFKQDGTGVIAHFNEWTTGFGLLYCKHFLPKVSTVFTTHATSIGRSISGNNKPLYDYMPGYFGDQMARELNMVSKHSVEKMAARHADCFTTVSEITATECRQLLEKDPDVITPNGFEDRFVPKGKKAKEARAQARASLIKVVQALCGSPVSEVAILVATSGRYEFRNKGLDVFIDSLSRLASLQKTKKEVIAFILVPGDVTAPRKEVIDRLSVQTDENLPPLYYPWTTHWLNHIEDNSVLRMIRSKGLTNEANKMVKVVYVPCYLNGDDGIFQQNYYELLPGFDLTVFPSYYEPWGYTPLESIAFSVPTVTTNLAGFGLWTKQEGDQEGIEDGVAVIDRNDHNQGEVAQSIANLIATYSNKTDAERTQVAEQARKLSKKAHWSEFIESYHQAYDFALRKRMDASGAEI
jgi:glycosyltransferase involved in cell wall biosynthesis